MNKNIPLFISSVIFMLVGVMHILRYFWKVPVVFGPWSVPLGISPVAGIVSLLLSLWCFAAARGK